MLCDHDRFISFLDMPIVTNNNILFNILSHKKLMKKNFTTPNNKLDVKKLLGCNW